MQPYVLLAKGHARAEDSLLLDYIVMNKFVALFHAIRKRHWLVYVSMITGIGTNLFQPFAGALISFKQVEDTLSTVGQTVTTVGLSPDFGDLNAFLAAAGFTEAAAFQKLPDPPFVKQGWASAQINLDGATGLNPTIQYMNAGVRSSPNCVHPPQVSLDTSNTNNVTITASTPDGCTSIASFNPNSTEQQYGSSPGIATTCNLPSNTSSQFLPVMFWFFRQQTDNGQSSPQGQAVICRPTIQVQNVLSRVFMTNGTVDSVDLEVNNNYTGQNNVTGGFLNGQAFNGVLLSDLAGNNTFIQARATAIRSGIPGAMFRLASQSEEGLGFYFSNPDGFLNLANTIYTQHLSVSAKSIYFVPFDDLVGVTMKQLVNKIVVDELAAIVLSVLLIGTGVIGILIHWLHLRMRRHAKLHLTSQPGSIATSVALTAHSGFGTLLLPYDDTETMRQKLKGMRFSLDARTGAIVADEFDVGDGDGDGLQSLAVSRSPSDVNLKKGVVATEEQPFIQVYSPPLSYSPDPAR